MAGERGGKLGDVGDANGDLELVRGGGGGGTRRLVVICCNSSALRSGTGGLLMVFILSRCRGCIGGLLSVSEPLGYECNRLRLPVAVLTVRFCVGSKDAESMLPFRPISDICGGRFEGGIPFTGIAGGSQLSAAVVVVVVVV